MASTARPSQIRHLASMITRIGAVVVVTGVFTLAAPALGTITPSIGSAPIALAGSAEVRLDRSSVPVRVRVPAIGIDLPMVSSELNMRGNRRGYPLCDVAHYWTNYDLPGAPGTAWIYAHAQPGMFLPLFTTSEATDGEGLLGLIIEVQLKDGRELRYRINEVRERATGRRIARGGGPSQHRLVMHTSTGPPGTDPKLMVRANLVDARRTSAKAPKPKPRPCSEPARNGNQNPSGNGSNGNGTATPTVEPDEELDPTTLALGAGAVLLGATLLAVVLIRK
jgi:hypothetical protein